MNMKEIIYAIISVILPMLIFWVVLAGIKSTYQFTEDDVKEQLSLVLNTKNYKILDKSNNSIWVGTPHEVTYNILLVEQDIVVSCKCTDSVFQPRICRKYE